MLRRIHKAKGYSNLLMMTRRWKNLFYVQYLESSDGVVEREGPFRATPYRM